MLLIILVILLGLLAAGTLFVRRLKPHGFVAWLLFTVALAFLVPSLFVSWGGFELKKTISPLVQITLFGMGITLTFSDFKRVLVMPKPIFLGMMLQFSVLPFASLLYIKLFGLTGEIAAGLVLMGSVAGGAASNVIVYLARGNLPLSITMTTCSTLAAPLATPFVFKMLAGAYISINFRDMMLSILWMIIMPLALGLLLNQCLPALARKLARALPAAAMFAICAINGITVAISRDNLLLTGLALGCAAICLHFTGLSLGYLFARLARLGPTDARTMSIEVGMQNGGMATGLAFDVLGQPLAALGSTVYGVFSGVFASALASHWQRTPPKENPTPPASRAE